ncbi:23S rRNA (guanosine(2251)-2'-O)-methyltransferase RlmB [Thermithiobacillus plumbiphilus]|uniref:23S rRNA (guanosine-2'-O-)-methyltransferase RlmB n=1 Tax=Thermithiobacillus plumbiphilus TaxID=1729899 RepID=A0ABU9D3I4_9PROT
MSNPGEWIFGIHAVEAALESGEIRLLRVSSGRDDRKLETLLALANQAGIPVEQKSREQLDRQFPGARHQGVAGQLKAMQQWNLDQLWERVDAQSVPPFLLLLDGLQDPHNVGACLRSAEAAGVQGVILPKDRACPINATVRKVASGAASRLPIVYVTNLARTLEEIRDRGIWVVGLAGEAEGSLYQQDLRGPLAIVAGAEGQGLRRLTREHCDALASIPMHPGCGSLNVSVATGIALFETLRQRQQAGKG